jgi:predicted adenylyl cyclase CyaB
MCFYLPRVACLPVGRDIEPLEDFWYSLNMSNIIEVERRAIIKKDQHDKLTDFLAKEAKDLGKDDKDVVFFVYPDKMLKVVNNVSKRTAKIVYKSNKIGNDCALEEIEVTISPSEFEDAIKLFSNLDYETKIPSFQKRHNYLYKEIEISLKYSDNWGYHLEMELVVKNSERKDEALAKIERVAEELNIKLMSNEEIKAHTDKIEKKFSI